jgi:hypothetical protein
MRTNRFLTAVRVGPGNISTIMKKIGRHFLNGDIRHWPWTWSQIPDSKHEHAVPFDDIIF